MLPSSKPVLIIDDDADMRAVLCHYLEEAGYEVFEAGNGEIGLAVHQQIQPPVVLLDLSMPVMNGIEFLRALPAARLQQDHFIILSATQEESMIKDCFDLGVQAFLAKPVSKEAVLGAVERSFKLSQAANEVRLLNEHLQLLLQALPALIWECDETLTLTYVSEASTPLLGYFPQEMRGRPLLQFVSGGDHEEFRIKFLEASAPLLFKQRIRFVELEFLSKTGSKVPLVVSANVRINAQGGATGLVGMAEDHGKWRQAKQAMSQVLLPTRLEVNREGKIISAQGGLEPYLQLTADPQGEYHRPWLRSYLLDPELEDLVTFAFAQREHIPFPIELEFLDEAANRCQFKIDFQYDAARDLLCGTATPVSTADNLMVMNHRLQEQEQKLNQAILLDEATKTSILKDCDNLITEMLDLLSRLESFALDEPAQFAMEGYLAFLHNKNLQEYAELLRFFANKLHGLKGTSGFMLPQLKTLCHQLEEIVKPLAELQLVYTSRLGRLIRAFVLYTQAQLDSLRNGAEAMEGSAEWTQEIAEAKSFAADMMQGQGALLQAQLQRRLKDQGELRRRTTDQEFISINKAGYEQLMSQVEKMFFGLVTHLPASALSEANSIFNDYVMIYKNSQQVPLDLSRYERLVPSMAKEYGKQAMFRFQSNGVKANREFWNAVHEICNHSIKNAVIHGLEPPQERRNAAKEEIGLVQVVLEENARQLFLTISDDGQGINQEKLLQAALSKGQLSPEQAARLSEQELLQLVFLPGISTAQTLDQNAGRGVGLNAVLESMRKFQGACDIATTPGRGAVWRFTFPKQAVSLPCVIVNIADMTLAIPEDNILRFYPFNAQDQVSNAGFSGWQIEDGIYPFFDTRLLFSPQVVADPAKNRQLMLMQGEKKQKYLLLINHILYRASLPLQPISAEMAMDRHYLGTALYHGHPIMVFNPAVEFPPQQVGPEVA